MSRKAYFEMNAVVTGGSGFLGRSVVGALCERNWQVRVIDNDSRGDSKLLDKDVEFHNVDIRDQEKVIETTKGVDLLIHLAFINGTKHFYEKPDLVVDVGIHGMVSVNEAVRRNDIANIIMFSTSETYQGKVEIPTPETVTLSIPDILNPRYSYGGAKIALELMTVHLTSKFVESWKIVRPHNIYGPNMGLDHVIPQLFQKAVEATSDSLSIEGDGTQTRSFCNIRDFQNAIGLIIEDDSKSEIYNIGTNEEISIYDLAKRIIDISGKSLTIQKSELPRGGVLRRNPDISKIKDLGFEQLISLDAGLRDYHNYLVQN